MKVLKIGFVGTRTDRPVAMVDFFERTLALRPMHGGDDMWAFRCCTRFGRAGSGGRSASRRFSIDA
jgi:hypothetical protein